MASRVSDKEKETILRLREEGLSWDSIAKEANRSVSGVRTICSPKLQEQARVRTREWYAAHPGYYGKNRERCKANALKYWRTHRKERKAYNLKYRVEHSEEIAAHKHAHYIEHHEEEAIHNRNYKATHREKCRALTRKYNHTERGRLADKNRKHRNRERKAHGKGFTLGNFELLWEKQKGRCAYCEQAMLRFKDIEGTLLEKVAPYGGRGNYRNIDHVIPLTKGGLHDPSNIVLACAECNNKKKDNIWEVTNDPRNV